MHLDIEGQIATVITLSSTTTLYPISSHSCGIPHPRSKCIALNHAFSPWQLFMGLCKGIWDLEQSHLSIWILTWESIQGFGTITPFNFDDPGMVIW